jgi:hypothetical protein
MMRHVKKAFLSPQVLQVEDVCLESSLLLGPSAVMQVIVGGQDYFEWDTDLEGVYTEEDWTLSD